MNRISYRLSNIYMFLLQNVDIGFRYQDSYSITVTPWLFCFACYDFELNIVCLMPRGRTLLVWTIRLLVTFWDISDTNFTLLALNLITFESHKSHTLSSQCVSQSERESHGVSEWMSRTMGQPFTQPDGSETLFCGLKRRRDVRNSYTEPW